MPYREAETWSFDLTDIGSPEFVITCRDPLDLPGKYSRKVGQAFALANRAQRVAQRNARLTPEQADQAEVIEDVPEWATTIIDEYVHRSILTWTLTYPPDHPTLAGQPIPLDDPTVEPLDEVKGYVLYEITGKLVDRLMAPPKSPVR